MSIGLVDAASLGENGSKLRSCSPAPCCVLCGVKSESWYCCEIDVVATVILSPSYSHWVSIVESIGSKSEIAKFCIMDDIFVSSVLTACTWLICAFVFIRSSSSS